MNKFKSGDLVSLRKGSPVIEVIMPSTSVASTYVCGWFDGSEYCQTYCAEKELVFK